MLLYQDVITGDEMLSDAYDVCAPSLLLSRHIPMSSSRATRLTAGHLTQERG